MKNLSCAALLVASFLCVGGCAHNDLPAGAQPVAVKSAVADTSVGSPAPFDAKTGLHGVVAERLDVPSYTYLRIKTPKGDTWAAIPTNPVTVGTEVTVMNPMPMQQFQSNTLKRTFDVIVFGQGIQTAGGAAPASGAPASNPPNPHETASMPNPHGGSGVASDKPKVDLENIKVTKASGPDAHTVAEVFEQSKTLKDKKVTIHAKVVKVTPGVMGRNWLHLRDGSGTDAAKSNDLVVTTEDEAKVNDEITISGTVHTDKDFGSGYSYTVLVEDAKIAR